MKKAAWIALLLALCTALCACQKTTAAVPACRDAAAAVLASQKTAEMTELSAKKIEKYLLIDETLYTDAAVCIDASRATAECVCVFTAKDGESLAAVQAALSDYCKAQLEQYRDYRPDEVPKLESALMKTRGMQTVLIVAPDADAAEAALDQIWNGQEKTK